MPINTPRKPETRNRPANFIASLAHGLSILEALGNNGAELSLAKLSSQVQLKKTTTWRLAHTLVNLGYVRQDSETRCFSLGPRVLVLGFGYFKSLDIKQLASPFLRDLSKRLGETVNMAVLDGDSLIYIERIKTSQIVNISLHIGSRLPLYNTSMGRVLASEMSQEWLSDYLVRLKNDPEARRYLDGNRLLRILADTRRRGYATNNEDLAKGLRSVASPIRGESGQIVAAVNIAVPSARVSISQLQRDYAPELLKTTAEISAALGYRN
jgi:IclR family transcriptional regulator, pca regulon regulatory protein